MIPVNFPFFSGETAYTFLKFLPVVLMSIMAVSCGQEKEKPGTVNSAERSRTLEYSKHITFTTASGDSVTSIRAAVADDQKERNEGLMGVSDLPGDAGMLFVFETEESRSFWMANTPLSLDIMFINSDMEIVRIHHSTEPFSQKNLSSGQPVQYVVETNGGFSISHDIREGMMISVSDT